MTLTSKQTLPSREIHRKTWDKRNLSSFKNQVADITKKWSVFAYLLIVSLLGTIIMEMYGDAPTMWYVVLCLLVVVTAFLETPWAKPKVEEKKTVKPKLLI